ncbi:hypothetical protein P9705_001276 [Enterococcus faecalis]|nr:hypothetical protein [Enterococcus faecalis]
MKTIEISFLDLATIIEGIYYGGDEDVYETEDLIDYLRENGDVVAVVDTFEGGAR